MSDRPHDMHVRLDSDDQTLSFKVDEVLRRLTKGGRVRVSLRHGKSDSPGDVEALLDRLLAMMGGAVVDEPPTWSRRGLSVVLVLRGPDEAPAPVLVPVGPPPPALSGHRERPEERGFA